MFIQTKRATGKKKKSEKGKEREMRVRVSGWCRVAVFWGEKLICCNTSPPKSIRACSIIMLKKNAKYVIKR